LIPTQLLFSNPFSFPFLLQAAVHRALFNKYTACSNPHLRVCYLRNPNLW
jgi:hypothetical protein